MTDEQTRQPQPPAKPRRTPRPLPSPLAVITASLGLFLVVLTLMALQVRNGRDPALGPGPLPAPAIQSATGGTAAQVTKVVTRASATGGAAGTAAAGGGAGAP
jgi:hypothetical protein